MADVFISYARADERSARRVADVLGKAGYALWWDADLPAHRSYSDEIEQQLRDASAVVVLWSRKASESQWVRAEADNARNAGKLVQVSLDGSIPPMPFNQIQCADLTGWRGANSHPGMRKALDSVAALVSGERAPVPIARLPRKWWGGPKIALGAAFALVLLLAAAFLLPRIFGGTETKRPIVAVLPFESLGKGDEGLVAGMWEDTRQAIGRNPQLLVLGPNTAEEIARRDVKSARKLADYLVEANVRSSGNRIRVSANLVRTEDGSELWSKSFDRKLDDVFALQSEIAGEIEGHIRGRLADRGGIRPENIATSGEVYALYSDARATIRRRQLGRYQGALDQLEKVVRMDPNFAPGWATLAVAKNFAAVGDTRSSSEADARRAIALAPNLAAGHAALGFALGNGPAAEAALRRAIELDPSDFEALHWLANSLDPITQADQKLALYSKVAELEPLWWPALFNKINLLLDTADRATIDQEFRRIEELGDPRLSAVVQAQAMHRRGDLSGAIKTALPHLRNASSEERNLLAQFLFEPLIQLGLFEIADQIVPPPSDFVPFLRANDPRALDMIEAQMPPRVYWRFGPLPTVAGRVYINNRQGSRLAKRYRAVATRPDEFLNVVGKDRLAGIAPIVALALRGTGDEGQARELLQLAEKHAQPPGRRPFDLVALARIRAVQGRPGEAMAHLSKAVSDGWLPNHFEVPTDIALDPALNELRGDPRFAQIRGKLLAYLAKERAELGDVRLN